MITAVHLPNSPEAAAEHAAAGGWIYAGGTVVLPQVNNGAVAATELVSLRRADLAGVSVQDGVVRIGAATPLSVIEADPDLAFLHPAVRSIASPTIRNLATVGGNLFARQPYGDFAVCLLALDAAVEIGSRDQRRTSTVAELLASGLAPGEVLTAVLLSVPAEGTWRYHKAMRRKLNSASIVTVAAVVETDASGVVTAARIALGGVAPRPVRASSAEAVLVGRSLEASAVDEAGEAARADISPFDDAYASAWYRARVLPVHLRRALLG